MGFWSTYLLFCLFSILSQVTAESPTPKTKKATNVKKGKKGAAAPPYPLEASSSPPSSSGGAVTLPDTLEAAALLSLTPVPSLHV